MTWGTSLQDLKSHFFADEIPSVVDQIKREKKHQFRASFT
jgi:hypothetical protein